MMRESDPHRYLGLVVGDGYKLLRYVGAGKVGLVYEAKSDKTGLVRACKVIQEGGLRDGWQRELEKVRSLDGVPHVVQYHTHGSDFDAQQRPFHWVLFDFIDGANLSDFAKEKRNLTVPLVESVVRTVLQVLHSCTQVGIYHGDLHAGNILVKNPDRRVLNSQRTIWISDFGYGGSHNAVRPKDDFSGLATIVQDLLAEIQASELNARDKSVFTTLQEFTKKRIRDGGRTPGLTPETLYREFEELCRKAERRSATGADVADSDTKQPADYLWAEALGNRIHEWRDLFVPRFLAANSLLARNNTVLTGARGCGKTMSFRRMTKLMDEIIGEPSGVVGVSSFVGFYLNCRDFTDAFPWVPAALDEASEQQVIHFFHLAWLAEVVKTIAYVDPDETADYQWLQNWLGSLPRLSYRPAVSGVRVLAEVRSFIEAQKEACRTVPIKFAARNEWPLARLDLLDTFFAEAAQHVPWLRDHPVFLFLDDYTIPLVPRPIQLALNPIVFRRRSALFFKVSTEAANSFVPTGVRKKPLELHHDFALIDLATESLHQDESEKAALLDSIFRPRIRRHAAFAQADYGLEDVLGKTPYTHNELAWQMRNAVGSKEKERIYYHGKEVFAGLWTSDIRTMVEMFNDMLREANGQITRDAPTIPKEVQHKSIRVQGGEIMTFTQSIRDYELWKQTSGRRDRIETFGNRLKSIVEAFIGVCKFELLEGPLIGNQGIQNPKQAFRIEVVDSFQPAKKVKGYLEGLVRYHIFLQDWRGKSRRGMLTPRLYLNRTLLPYGGLTLSSHDHIQLKNDELMQLLEKPTEFVEYWARKRRSSNRIKRAPQPRLI